MIFWKAQCRKTDFHQDLLVQNTTPKTRPTTNASTPTVLPTFAPVLIPLSLLFRSVLSEGDSIDVGVGSDVEEEVAEAGVVLSDDGVAVMTVCMSQMRLKGRHHQLRSLPTCSARQTAPKSGCTVHCHWSRYNRLGPSRSKADHTDHVG